MFTNSTDAYHLALKIMGHDYANKYANYWSKKNKTIKSGKSQTSKTLVDKKRTMQSSVQLQSIVSCIQIIKKFKKLNWKQSEKFSRRLQNLKPIKSCVRTNWFKW